MTLKANPKMLDQMQYCEEQKIPLAIIVGERELEEGILKIRDVPTRIEEVSYLFMNLSSNFNLLK
ncbi:unnamed protein product [Gongylonema pulchrum]|uniref:HGTP_anticodon domain-containing protein n=1 Tax=Gongylonema pulchrum TaxID=637853 RepID=A0A183DAM1_9BILA|nr:unnamed protein product [Gongylonema pulchrum]